MPVVEDIVPLMTGARYVAQNITAPERINRAIAGIEGNLKEDPGIVFDHAKSLIEMTCKTLLKECGLEADIKWKVQQLAKFTLKTVIFIPNGHPNPGVAKDRLESSLSSLVGIVHSVGALRNSEGEIGHGTEADRVPLTSCHAEFVARAADAVVKFLTECHVSAKESNVEPLTYSANPTFNDYIDELHPAIAIFTGQYKPSEVLYQMDRQVYQDALTEYLQEPKAEDE